MPGNHRFFYFALLYIGNLCFSRDSGVSYRTASRSEDANFIFSRDREKTPQIPDASFLLKKTRPFVKPDEEVWVSGAENERQFYMLFGCAVKDRAEVFRHLYRSCGEDAGIGKPLSLIFGLIEPGKGLKYFIERAEEQLRQRGVFNKNIFVELGAAPGGLSMQALFNESAIYGEEIINALKQRELPKLGIVIKEMCEYLRKNEYPTETILYIVKYQYLRASKELSAILRFDWEEEFNRLFSESSEWEEVNRSLRNLFSGLLSDHELMHNAEDMMKLIDEYISSHYSEHITNQTLSKKIGFVPSYISKLFREYKGVSPGDYLIKVRITKAAELIKESGNIHVSSAAKAVGFTDPSYFSRLFKQHIGMLPTEWKEKYGTKK